MYQDIIDKLISITDTIPWFRACADTNMMYDEELDKIIIDFSFESIDSNGIKYFERYCKDNDIPIDKILFLNGNLRHEYSYIYSVWYFAHRLKKIFNNELPWVSDEGQKFGLVNSDVPKSKIYNCFNNSEHTHRTMVYDLLKENNLLDYGYVSYRDKDIFLPEDVEYVTSLKYPEVMTTDFEDSDASYGAFNPLVTSRTYFNLVTETHCETDDLFITEKTLKALISQPFMVVGNYGTLEYLKEKGFETYPELFDESYDLIKNHNERIEFIINEVKRLCEMNVDKLQKIYESVFSKVIHNRNIIRHWESDEFLEELKSRHEDFPDHSSF